MKKRKRKRKTATSALGRGSAISARTWAGLAGRSDVTDDGVAQPQPEETAAGSWDRTESAYRWPIIHLGDGIDV